MSNFKIETKGSDVLRKKAKPIKEITPEIKKLAEEMFDIMYRTNGIGLAAPQIGISKRIIVIDIEEYDELNPPPMVLINPKIIARSDEEQLAEEGCLSVPELTGPIRRANYVKVEATNLDGKKVIIEGEGLMARVLQHEIDHLNGTLFVDRLNEEDDKLFKKQRARSIFGA